MTVSRTYRENSLSWTFVSITESMYGLFLVLFDLVAFLMAYQPS